MIKPRRVAVVTPAAEGSLSGNRVTAERWARRLRELGWEASVVVAWRGEPIDLMVALHAVKSYESIAAYREQHPAGPLVVALTGTDVYGDERNDEPMRRALAWADGIVVLQPLAAARLAPALARKARVIYQSAVGAPRPATPATDVFEVCFLSHLRAVKDPLLAARATRLLESASKILLTHAGAALDPSSADAATREMAENPRYHWLGPLPPTDAAALLARSRALLLTSAQEGGANVVSEAIVAGVPVLTTAIEGSLGLLGDDYPGTFPVGDAKALAALLRRAERDPAFLADLEERVRALAPRHSESSEREAWKALLAGILHTP